MKLNVAIVTQEEQMFAGEADQITLPAEQGEITVLPGHEPLMSTLMAGEAVIRQAGHDTRLVLSPGFVQIADNQVTVLADSAVREEELDEAKAEEARAAAERAMQEARSETEVAITLGTIERTLMELQAIRRRKSRHTH